MTETVFQEFDDDEVTQRVFDKSDPDGSKRAKREQEKQKPTEKPRTCCWPI